MAIPVNSAVQITYTSTLFGQFIQNILHYKVASTGSQEDQLLELKDIANHFADLTASVNPLNLIQACTSSSMEIQNVKAQVVYPVRTIYQRTDILSDGARGPATLTNVAVSISKRARDPGRTGSGRIQLGGIAAGDYSNGVITNDFSTTVNALLFNLTTPITLAAGGTLLRPIVFGPSFDGTLKSDLLRVQVEQTVRTMHRRTVGLGI